MLKADDYAVPEAKMWGWMSNPNVKQPKPVVETGRMGNPMLAWVVDQMEASKRYREYEAHLQEVKKDLTANHGYSREECKKLGIARYRGPECKKCGCVVRYANNATCVHCNNVRESKRDRSGRNRY